MLMVNLPLQQHPIQHLRFPFFDIPPFLFGRSDVGGGLGPWFDVDEKGNLPDRPLYRIPEALALGNYTVSRWLVEAVIMLCTQPPLPPTTTHRILMVFLSKIDGANPPVFPSRDLCDACTRSKILHCPRNPDVDYRYRRSSPWVLEGNCGACTSAWTAQVLQFSARCASRVV